MVRDGIAWLLIDTAGLAEKTADPIEAIGIDRARAALEEADIVLWLGDDAPTPHSATLWIHARADVPARAAPCEGKLAVSATTGAGLEQLWTHIGALAGELLPPSDELALNRRQRSLATAAAEALGRAAMQHDALLVAEELRIARSAFDAITGRADVEAMLDALFSRFCIGK